MAIDDFVRNIRCPGIRETGNVPDVSQAHVTYCTSFQVTDLAVPTPSAWPGETNGGTHPPCALNASLLLLGILEVLNDRPL